MKTHHVHAHPSKDELPREDQLAWKMAEVAADSVAVESDVTDMIINRIIDNASVAVASLNRGPIKTARAQARAVVPVVCTSSTSSTRRSATRARRRDRTVKAPARRRRRADGPRDPSGGVRLRRTSRSGTTATPVSRPRPWANSAAWL